MEKLNKTCKFCKGEMEYSEGVFQCECGAMIQENENTWTLPFDINNQYA